MRLEDLISQANAATGGRATAARRRSAYAAGEMLLDVERVLADAAAPERTRARAEAFLAILAEKAERQGEQFWHPTWLLNGVGEAMVVAGYRAQAVLKFLKTELYFYGLDWIERRHRHQSMELMVAHADMLDDYFSRAALAAMGTEAEERRAQGRPFCIVHHYVNALRKRHWADRRNSTDACDAAVSLMAAEVERSGAVATAPAVDEDADGAGPGEDRVRILLEIFERDLTPVQQRVYLARHPVEPRAVEGAPSVIHDLAEQEASEGGRETWKGLAERFGVTEKTIKREYLRALHLILSQASLRISGERPASGFVRRMLETLRVISEERDLRIRDNAGRGLGKIVERWEIALRFVLNHEGVASGSDERELGA